MESSPLQLTWNVERGAELELELELEQQQVQSPKVILFLPPPLLTPPFLQTPECTMQRAFPLSFGVIPCSESKMKVNSWFGREGRAASFTACSGA